MRITPYGQRFWAVYDASDNLVCVTVYRKGAVEVVRRLSPPERIKESAVTPSVAEPPASSRQKSALRAVASHAGWSGDRIDLLVRSRFGKPGLDDLSRQEARTLLHEIVQGSHPVAPST